MRRRSVVFVLAAAVMLSGCASRQEVAPDTTTELVWPLPPSVPRYRYVEALCGERDLAKGGKIGDMLFGEEKAFTLQWPQAAAADSRGNVYVSDRWGLVMLDREAAKVRQVGAEAGPGRLLQPLGVAVDSEDRLYVADLRAARVYVYGPDRALQMAIGREGEFKKPISVGLDEPRRRFFVADGGASTVRAYSMDDGSFLFEIQGITDDPERHFGFPVQVAVNSEGMVYVVDSSAARILVFTPEGTFDRWLFGLGSAPGSLVRPKGLAVDAEDNLYVSDAATKQIQIVGSADEYLLYFGGGGVEPGKFFMPAMLSVDRHDRLYVADRGPDGCVHIFQYLGNRYYAEHPEETRPVATNPATEEGEGK